MNRVLCLVLPARIFLLPLVIIQGYEPEFVEPLKNLTVPVGREATFSCVVSHLGGYRVGWVKADTKAIQAIHEHVITHNPRVSVSHSDHSTWFLHIRNVQEEDRGTYMCQINTDPMKSEMGYLEIVVPPDIIDEDSSGDIMVPEGGTVELTCRARGYPDPEITWKREDRQEIVFREASGIRNKVRIHEGSTLRLPRISRSDMGHYMCMASNGVPPAVSKRISINVHFPPVIQVPNQLVGAPLGTDVNLECYVEASPKAIIYWMRDSMRIHEGSTLRLPRISRSDMGHYMCMASNGVPPAVSKRISINVHFPPVIQVPNQLVGAPLGTDVNLECYVEASPKAIIYWMRDSSDTMLVTSEKYETKVSVRSIFETKMSLKVHHLQKADVGTYRCIAKNSLGEVERSIRLYEIPGSVTRKVSSTAIVLTEDQEEEDQEEEEEIGSAEKGLPETPPPRRHHDHHIRANLDVPPSVTASSYVPLPSQHHLLAFLALATRSI